MAGQVGPTPYSPSHCGHGEQHFTVVQWDHRGAGKTLGRNGKVGSGEMTFGRRVADAVELVEFLRNYLDQDKVILLAESMGTLTGMPLVNSGPQGRR
jgi:alpha-beta hydrolase superfamily lysophospholipase